MFDDMMNACSKLYPESQNSTVKKKKKPNLDSTLSDNSDKEKKGCYNKV